MTNLQWQQLESAVQAMTDDEKQRLLALVSASLAAPPAAAESEQQRLEFAGLIARMSNLPDRNPDDGLCVSRDHDQVLYGKP
jgi:hypothetical protein